MATLMGIFIGFVLLVVLVGVSHRATTGYSEKIQQLKAEKQQLQTRIQDLRRNMTNLKEMELSLSRQLDGETRGQSGMAGGSVRSSRMQARSEKRREQAKSIVDVLLAERLLTPEDLAKAEAYKAQSQSPYPLDEIIAMLGYVSSEAILRVKSRYPNLS